MLYFVLLPSYFIWNTVHDRLPTVKDFIVLSANALTVYKYRHLGLNVPRSTLPLVAKLWLQPSYQWICVETDMIATRKKCNKNILAQGKWGVGFSVQEVKD